MGGYAAMGKKRRAQTRRQSVDREIERERAILEARLAHPMVRASIGEALDFAREAHRKAQEAGLTGWGAWNEMEPGARRDPYGLWHSVSQALGVSFLVHADRNGEPTVATALERRVCYAAVGEPDENDPAKPLGPRPLGDPSAVSLKSGSTPFGKSVEVAVNLYRSDRELRAAFDLLLADLRNARRAANVKERNRRRMTAEEIMRAVPIYRDLTDGFTLARAAERAGINRKAAERLFLRLSDQDEEFQLPKIQRSASGWAVQQKPEHGYCAACPDGHCAGCALAAAMAKERLTERDLLVSPEKLTAMSDAIAAKG
jgi:hypothetical protein